MAQDERHLTTEELSSYLDGQSTPEERTRWEGHLHGCEQCTQGLASLRQTAALLHALPQPPLPRSFVLSPAEQLAPSVARAHSAAVPPLSLEAQRARHQASPTTDQRQRWPGYVRGTLRTLSALAAVAGLLLFLTGLLTALPQATSMNTASSAAPEQRSSAQQPRTQGTPTTPNADITPQVDNGKNALTPPAYQVPSQLQPAPTQPIKEVPSTPPPLLPNLPFFDLTSSPGRVGLGMLLVLLGVMGFVVFKQRRKRGA